jgi:2-C-methyl-D-erythritol 4-phosphate cytidylyltransferase
VVGRATDDAALLEALGHPVKLVRGETINFKITTADDLELAEAWLSRETSGARQERDAE